MPLSSQGFGLQVKHESCRCRDNAVVESFFATLTKEWVARRRYFRDTGSSKSRAVRVHRDLVQSQASPFDTRVPEPSAVWGRTTAGRSTGVSTNRGKFRFR